MQVFASKDAEIEDLRKRLAATEKQRAELEKAHKPCDDLIASLRKQLAALEGDTKVSARRTVDCVRVRGRRGFGD